MTLSLVAPELRELRAQIHTLPDWMPMGGITIGRHIFIKNNSNWVMIAHELVHVRQQRDHFFKFWLTYLIFPLPIFWSWRYRWEAEAYARDVKYGRLTLDKAADAVSGLLYLWPCRRKTARAAIEKYFST